MFNEQLISELQTATGMLLPKTLVDLAQRVNENGGSSIADNTSTTDLWNWENNSGHDDPNWKKLLLELSDQERRRTLLAIGSAARAYTQRHTPLLNNGTVGEIRDLPLKNLFALPMVGAKYGSFLRLSFLKPEFEDDFTLREMPSKRDLEDFLRGMYGIPSIHGRRPIYNLETHRFER
jgi:hypothetical protein